MPELSGLLLIAALRWAARRLLRRRPGRHERKGKHEQSEDAAEPDE